MFLREDRIRSSKANKLDLLPKLSYFRKPISQQIHAQTRTESQRTADKMIKVAKKLIESVENIKFMIEVCFL